MKPISRVLSAVCSVALWVTFVSAGVTVLQLSTTSSAYAAVVGQIQVQGNKRVDSATIRSYVDIEPGRRFNNADINDGIKRLFATGLFSDVSIRQSGSVLVINVDEYPIVNQVLFQGNKKIKDVNLVGAVDLAPRGTFNQGVLESDEDRIEQAYEAIGRSDATVSGRIIELGDNRVNVVFEINEGGRTKIKDINIIGNNAFGDRRLRDVIKTKRSNYFSFIFRNDVYDEDRLRADEETLRQFYFNRGYADFRILSSEAVLDDNSNEYSISITIDEGERYTFSSIELESTVPGVDTSTLQDQLETKPGKVYSAEDVEDTIIGLTEAVAEQGYAFSEVVPRGDRDFDNRTIAVVYTIDQGPRTYIERIEIRGNTRTRDYVVRREIDVSEGDAFNQVLIQRARRRLVDLDFFEQVEISTVPGSAPDQVVVLISLEEKSTGEFSIGAGYSTGGEDSGANIEGTISEKNFLGRGQFIRLSAGGGEDVRTYQLSFTEPYFLGRRIAAGFDLFHSNRNYDNYESEISGGTIRFGLPITDEISASVAYNYTREEYTLDDGCNVLAGCLVAPSILQAVATSPWVKSSVSGSLLYNTIDDMNNPHSGIYALATAEYAGLGGDASYVKLTARSTYYRTLSEEQDIVGLLVAGAGNVSGIGTDGLRVFDLFQNNARMIRGFEFDGIGPYDATTGEHLGGNTYLHATAEAQFPMPLAPDSFGLKAAVFTDAATLYGNDLINAVDPGMQWRASVGASLIWASPFGPLRVDYAYPILKEDGDDIQNFNFGISTRF